MRVGGGNVNVDQQAPKQRMTQGITHAECTVDRPRSDAQQKFQAGLDGRAEALVLGRYVSKTLPGCLWGSP